MKTKYILGMILSIILAIVLFIFFCLSFNDVEIDKSQKTIFSTYLNKEDNIDKQTYLKVRKPTFICKARQSKHGSLNWYYYTKINNENIIIRTNKSLNDGDTIEGITVKTNKRLIKFIFNKSKIEQPDNIGDIYLDSTVTIPHKKDLPSIIYVVLIAICLMVFFINLIYLVRKNK